MKKKKHEVNSNHRMASCDPDIEKQVKSWLLRDMASISLFTPREQRQKKKPQK